MMKLTRETIDSSHESWFSKKGGEAVSLLYQGIPYKYRVLWLREIIEFMLEKHGMEGSYRTILKVFCETVPSEHISRAFKSTWWSSKNNLKQMIKDILHPALKLAYNSKEKAKGNFRFLYDETAGYAFGEALMELICESDIEMLPVVWELMLRKGLDLQKNSMFLLEKSRAEEPVLKRYEYRHIKRGLTWGIAIDITADFSIGEDFAKNTHTAVFEDKIGLFFREKETRKVVVKKIIEAIETVSDSILKKLKSDEIIEIEVIEVSFSFTDFEEDGMKWAMIGWLSQELGITAPEVRITNAGGRYHYEEI